MKKELYERVGILEESGIISFKVAEYTRWVIVQLLKEIPEITQDKAEMFITHLAMAGKRAEEGAEENPIDPGVLEMVKSEAVFSRAVDMRDRFLAGTDIVFPETEKDFLSVHICNLLL